MILEFLNEDERNMLLALVKSPVYPILLKVANHDRQGCLEKMAVEKDKDNILRLQGRAEGCVFFKNAPKIIAQHQVEAEAKRLAKAAKKPKG